MHGYVAYADQILSILVHIKRVTIVVVVELGRYRIDSLLGSPTIDAHILAICAAQRAQSLAHWLHFGPMIGCVLANPIVD